LAKHDELFSTPGTSAPNWPMPPVKQFIVVALMAGAAATSTLAVVTPADAAAMQAATIESRTLPAMPSAPPAVEPSAAVPALLQRLRRVSGLSWGEVAAAVGVSRRTIHNWLSGARVASVHLARLAELDRLVNAVAAGSAHDTRARLLQAGPHGRSLLEEMAFNSRPARRRPISTLSVGDLIGPVEEPATVSHEQPPRQSSLRGGPLSRRRPGES
jgi:transcriptional regulator with XRE-family HTH domain